MTPQQSPDAATPQASGPAPDPAELIALLQQLTARVDSLEAELATVRRAQEEEVGEEVLLAIAAAVAGYLGKRARVRQVRLRRGPGWTSQGRATIQQSHAITRR